MKLSLSLRGPGASLSLRRPALALLMSMLAALPGAGPARAQAYGEADRGAPGDLMIQRYLEREAAKISDTFAEDLQTPARWAERRPRYQQEYLAMLGLSPLPERTPLRATVTGTLAGEGYRVEMLHYQSRPGLYVTGNLYRPARVREGEKLPAVFYVCGHSHRGRDGNKVAYQSHGIWLARHGYVCLVVDSLQLGEIAAFHHGTYNLERWWWHSRGYTPAGVEAWNGVRGIDYLVSRPDVDPTRIAVTGISGGGAATFWIAAADERVAVAVPVSGMADLESYVGHRVINGHCDCMFLYNSYRWPWTRIAALIAPRPLLFVNSDADPIFPMDANERVIARLERIYAGYGASDRVDAIVSLGGHAYRQDIRQAAYRFLNAHLQGEARPITDSEVDLVSEGSRPGPSPITPERLRVFPKDSDVPADQINTVIDERFVPLGNPGRPAAGGFDRWRTELWARLRQSSFGYFPETIPAASRVPGASEASGTERLASEEGIEFRLRHAAGARDAAAREVLLVVLDEAEAGQTPEWVRDWSRPGQQVVLCEPRGVGATRWTRTNPPNYVERSHVLLGRTADAGRVWDVAAAARFLAQGDGRSAESGSEGRKVSVLGRGAPGVLAAYAALVEERIAEVTLVTPPTTHQTNAAPRFLNVLRVADIPQVLGLLAPRPLTLAGAAKEAFAATAEIYAAAGSPERLSVK